MPVLSPDSHLAPVVGHLAEAVKGCHADCARQSEATCPGRGGRGTGLPTPKALAAPAEGPGGARQQGTPGPASLS